MQKEVRDLQRHSQPSGKAQETSRSSLLLRANEKLMTIQGGRLLFISNSLKTLIQLEAQVDYCIFLWLIPFS